MSDQGAKGEAPGSALAEALAKKARARQGRDRSLVEASRAGDEKAFGKLYDSWVDHVYDRAITAGASAAEAREVTEQTFLAMHRDLPKLKQPAAFGAKILQVARRETQERVGGDRRPVGITGAAGAAEDRLTRATDAASTAADHDVAVVLREASGALDEKTREALDLHFRQGLTKNETAAVLGETPEKMTETLAKLPPALATLTRARVLWRSGTPEDQELKEQLAAAGVKRFNAAAVRAINGFAKDNDRARARSLIGIPPIELFAAIPLADAPAGLKSAVATVLVVAAVPMEGSKFVKRDDKGAIVDAPKAKDSGGSNRPGVDDAGPGIDKRKVAQVATAALAAEKLADAAAAAPTKPAVEEKAPEKLSRKDKKAKEAADRDAAAAKAASDKAASDKAASDEVAKAKAAADKAAKADAAAKDPAVAAAAAGATGIAAKAGTDKLDEKAADEKAADEKPSGEKAADEQAADESTESPTLSKRGKAAPVSAALAAAATAAVAKEVADAKTPETDETAEEPSKDVAAKADTSDDKAAAEETKPDTKKPEAAPDVKPDAEAEGTSGKTEGNTAGKAAAGAAVVAGAAAAATGSAAAETIDAGAEKTDVAAQPDGESKAAPDTKADTKADTAAAKTTSGKSGAKAAAGTAAVAGATVAGTAAAAAKTAPKDQGPGGPASTLESSEDAAGAGNGAKIGMAVVAAVVIIALLAFALTRGGENPGTVTAGPTTTAAATSTTGGSAKSTTTTAKGATTTTTEQGVTTTTADGSVTTVSTVKPVVTTAPVVTTTQPITTTTAVPTAITSFGIDFPETHAALTYSMGSPGAPTLSWNVQATGPVSVQVTGPANSPAPAIFPSTDKSHGTIALCPGTISSGICTVLAGHPPFNYSFVVTPMDKPENKQYQTVTLSMP